MDGTQGRERKKGFFRSRNKGQPLNQSSNRHSLDCALNGGANGSCPGSNPNGITLNGSSIPPSGRISNFNSLDESNIFSREQNRRFMGAPPRRARSAERFEGMRVTNNSIIPSTKPHANTHAGKKRNFPKSCTHIIMLWERRKIIFLLTVSTFIMPARARIS